MSYWKICIEEAFGDIGIEATDDQLKEMVEWVEGAHENYGLATGEEYIPNPQELENVALKKELEREKNKTICPECKGDGSLTSHGPCHSSTSSCWKCNGAGFLYQG